MNNQITGGGEERHPIERLMGDSMASIKGLVDADTIIGSPVCTSDGKVILPVSKVTMGFMTGGGEYSDVSKKGKKGNAYPFAGGSSGGITVSPIGFLINDNNNIRMISISGESGYEKLLGLVPEVIGTIIKGAKN